MNVLLKLLHYSLHNDYITSSYVTVISIFPSSVITFEVLYFIWLLDRGIRFQVVCLS